MSIVFNGRVFSVELSRMPFPNGQVHEVAIVRHAPAVVIVPFEDDGRVVLIRQYRPAIDRQLWEVPAGSTDAGETAEGAARRECEEEIGRAPQEVERLGTWYPAPGYCDEQLIFFRATGLRAPDSGSARQPDADEDITAQSFTLADARAMVARGEIVDLKTAYALTLV